MAPPSPRVSAAYGFMDFVNASPTPFHAVKEVKDRLSIAGFKEIKEKESWSSACTPGGKYYLTRNASTLVAFAIGKKWKPGNPIAMIGVHTDSPCLRVKPVSRKQSDGYLQVGVETYGEGLWHTWFDRDLSAAGRVMVRDGKGSAVQKLVHIKRPILRVPTLAAHLDRQETFSFNQETQLFPIAGLVAAELNRRDKPTEAYDKETAEDKPSEFTPLKPMSTRHHPRFVKLIAAELDEEVEDIVDFEIVLYDTQKACLGGLMEEFIFSARLDNLNSTYCATMGLIESVRSETALDKETSVRMIACFDHEEVGSMSAQGAFSTMLPGVARRLSVLPMAAFTQAASENSYDNVSKAESEHSCDRVSEEGMATAYEQTMSSSFLLSADMAHAVNPNFGAKYESDHRPEMNKGPVIKVNANAHYATNSPGIVLLQEVARKEGVPLQLFVVRNDSSCGSTIGPILAAHLGARTLDLGNPQISMHSCRECGGADDVHHAIRLFHGFFQYYSALEKTILVD